MPPDFKSFHFKPTAKFWAVYQEIFKSNNLVKYIQMYATFWSIFILFRFTRTTGIYVLFPGAN